MQNPSCGEPLERELFEQILTEKAFLLCFYKTRKEVVLDFLEAFDRNYGHLELHYKYNPNGKDIIAIREYIRNGNFIQCDCPDPGCMCFYNCTLVMQELLGQLRRFFKNLVIEQIPKTVSSHKVTSEGLGYRVSRYYESTSERMIFRRCKIKKL